MKVKRDAFKIRVRFAYELHIWLVQFALNYQKYRQLAQDVPGK